MHWKAKQYNIFIYGSRKGLTFPLVIVTCQFENVAGLCGLHVYVRGREGLSIEYVVSML